MSLTAFNLFSSILQLYKLHFAHCFPCYFDYLKQVYGWCSCPLFNYAKCYVRDVERMRMFPGSPPNELVLQAEAAEMDCIELDVNDTHPYLSVLFEDFDADVVFSESWKR